MSLNMIALLTLIPFTALLFFVPRSKLSLPPGPKGSLLSGNSHQLPQTESWKTYAKWGAQYGTLMLRQM